MCYVISTPLQITDDLAKYMKESITIAMYEENATFENFVSAIDLVKSSSDADDTVVIIPSGHGSKLGFSFRDGHILYDSINEQLNKLSSKIILLNDSCYSGASLKYLSSSARVIMS